MTTAPVGVLLRRIAVPASIGFLFNNLYNIVDAYYGGLWSTAALAALSLTFPVFFTIIAFSIGLFSGVSALVAAAIGAGDESGTKKITAQALSLSVLSGLLLSAAGWFAGPWLLRLLGAEGEYLALADQYLRVIFAGNVFFLLTFVLSGILSARGDTASFRNFLVAGFFLNLIFDPWFMYGGLGLPGFGLAGVAWATVVIQVLGTAYLLVRVCQTGIICPGSFGLAWPERATYAAILRQAVPASLNTLMTALGVFVIVYFVNLYGPAATAAYGTAVRIDQLALLPMIGLNIALLALVGQNDGAGQPDRVRAAYRTALLYGLIVTLPSFAAVFAFARPIIAFFTPDPEVIAIGARYLRISAVAYWGYVVIYISTAYLQGLRRPNFPVVIGLYRQVAAPAVIFWLAVNYWHWGLTGIWWGITALVWSSAIFIYMWARRVKVTGTAI